MTHFGKYCPIKVNYINEQKMIRQDFFLGIEKTYVIAKASYLKTC